MLEAVAHQRILLELEGSDLLAFILSLSSHVTLPNLLTWGSLQCSVPKGLPTRRVCVSGTWGQLSGDHLKDSSPQSEEASTAIMSTLEMRNLRHNEVKKFTHHQVVNQWENYGMNKEFCLHHPRSKSLVLLLRKNKYMYILSLTLQSVF